MSDILLRAKMSDDDITGSSSDSVLSSSPGSKCLLVGGGSDLFRSVLEDYVTEADTKISKSEFNRYKSKQMNKGRCDRDHSESKRCESCQCVMAFCKCEQYHGREREFGHRVHWADEVWERPLKTYFEEDEDMEESEELCLDNQCSETITEFVPKPILKHRANCIVIISE